jgi:hypothetical protein
MAIKRFERGTSQSLYFLPVITLFQMAFEIALEDCLEHYRVSHNLLNFMFENQPLNSCEKFA